MQDPFLEGGPQATWLTVCIFGVHNPPFGSSFESEDMSLRFLTLETCFNARHTLS